MLLAAGGLTGCWGMTPPAGAPAIDAGPGCAGYPPGCTVGLGDGWGGAGGIDGAGEAGKLGAAEATPSIDANTFAASSLSPTGGLISPLGRLGTRIFSTRCGPPAYIPGRFPPIG